MVEGDYMLGDINNYKDKINNILTNKQYSKKTPLNTYTSQLLINKFKFNPHRTYITINTLQKKIIKRYLVNREFQQNMGIQQM